MKYEILKWENKKAVLLKGINISLFVKTNENIEELYFEKFEFKKADLEEHRGIIIFGDSNILELLGEYINITNKNIFESLNELKDAFKKKAINILKFRGDLAEAIFLYNLGGEKIYEGSSSDIRLKGHMIEIKSFSPQKKTIHISLEQLREKTEKYAIEILMDNDGKTIIDLANSINSNSEFKNYLKKTYKNSVFEYLKYKLSSPININKKLPTEKFNSRIIRATFEISIQ